MNRDSWASLTDTQQAALDQLSGADLGRRAYNAWKSLTGKGLAIMGNTEGKALIELDPAAAAEFDAASARVLEQVVSDLEARGAPAAAIVAAMGGG